MGPRFRGPPSLLGSRLLGSRFPVLGSRASRVPVVRLLGFTGPPDFSHHCMFYPDPADLLEFVPGGCRERPYNFLLLFSTDMVPTCHFREKLKPNHTRDLPPSLVLHEGEDL